MTYRRQRLFSNPLIVDLWRQALATAIREKPFDLQAGVVLPDHIHLVIGLPKGDADISSRVGRAKTLLTKSLGSRRTAANPSRQRHRESSVWQRRFFDHVIRDERDYALRIDYVHYNPVKHGYVRCPKDWPYSSFERWVERGVYPSDWGCPGLGVVSDFKQIEDSVGE